MNVLLDTNVLGRLVELGHVQHKAAQDAIDALVARGDAPRLVPQVIYEFWTVATRPPAVNGIGLTPSQAAGEVAKLTAIFPLLPDGPSILPEWLRVVTGQNVSGKAAHDARLVAAMNVHQVTHILTFNTSDFARYPGITALDPDAFASASPSTP